MDTEKNIHDHLSNRMTTKENITHNFSQKNRNLHHDRNPIPVITASKFGKSIVCLALLDVFVVNETGVRTFRFWGIIVVKSIHLVFIPNRFPAKRMKCEH